MKINVGKAARTVATKAAANPEAALALVGLIAPGLFRKLAPKVIPVIVAVAGKR